MRIKPILLVIGLSALFAAAGALVPRAAAQDSAATDGPAEAAAKRKVRTKVVPEYPTLAKQMNIFGKVRIEVNIAADGHVTGTRVVGGSPLLVNAAVEAVKKWRFEPAPKDSMEIVEFEFGS